ncbi:PrgI family protein [Candidatus Parcubacteria bacterium]|nr:PrgI family protein [Candidatus Parcubacteria bacterium]
MQQFTVPQFIDVEDKILGPITTRQFLIMIGAVLFAAAVYKLTYFSTFLAIVIPELIISAIFAFYKVDEMPFHYFVLNFIQTNKSPKTRVWNNSFGKDNVENSDAIENVKVEVINDDRTRTSSRLNELALMVDTQGVYKGEKDDETKISLHNKKI